ncbi:MAG: hypothetical protein FJ222_08720 [Lentisphaerae bacterium]|nr:hypothetical protein [Lentisphaerota bacterium]
MNTPEWSAEKLRIDVEPGLDIGMTLGYPEFPLRDRLIVIFPPHPSLGGDSANNVVEAVFAAALASGRMAVKLNYRGTETGVIRSESALTVWDRMEAATDYAVVYSDSASLVARALEAAGPVDQVVFVGYSFGAYAALETAARTGVRRVVGISPPLLSHPFADRLAPGLHAVFLSGANDPFCPIGALRGLAGAACSIVELAVDDHFYRGDEPRVARAALQEALC